MYIYLCVCVYIHMCIYIYAYTYIKLITGSIYVAFTICLGLVASAVDRQYI